MQKNNIKKSFFPKQKMEDIGNILNYDEDEDQDYQGPEFGADYQVFDEEEDDPNNYYMGPEIINVDEEEPMEWPADFKPNTQMEEEKLPEFLEPPLPEIFVTDPLQNMQFPQKIHTLETLPHYLESFKQVAPSHILAADPLAIYEVNEKGVEYANYPIRSMKTGWGLRTANYEAEANLFDMNTFQSVWNWILVNGEQKRMKHFSNLTQHLGNRNIFISDDEDFEYLISLFYYFFAELFYDVESLEEIQDPIPIQNTPLLLNTQYLNSFWSRRETAFQFAMNFFNWIDNSFTREFMYDPTYGLALFNWQQIFTNRHISMDLYHLFLMFYHKMIMFSIMINPAQALKYNFSITNQLSRTKLVEIQYHPYKWWFRVYLAWIQNLSYVLYKQIIKSTFDVRLASGRYYSRIAIPKEMGNLMYWNVNTDGMFPIYMNPFNKNVETSVYPKIFVEKMNATNTNILNNNFRTDKPFGYSDIGDLESYNNNLAKILGDFILQFMDHFDEEANRDVGYYFNVVYTYYSGIQLDNNAQENRGYWTSNCQINMFTLCQALREYYYDARGLQARDGKGIITLFHENAMKFVMHRITFQIMSFIQRYAPEMYDENEFMISEFIMGDIKESKIHFNNQGILADIVREVSIIGLKYFGFLHLADGKSGIIDDHQITYNLLQSFHGASECDVFVPESIHNCMMQCLFFIIIAQLNPIDQEYYDYEYFNIYLDKLLGTKKCLHMMSLISKGQIWEVCKMYNALQFSLKIVIYVYNSNVVIFKDEYMIEDEKTMILFLKDTKIGFMSKEKFRKIFTFRSNAKYWRKIPKNLENIVNKNLYNIFSFEKKKKNTTSRNVKNNVEIWGWDTETIIYNYDEKKKINKYDAYCICFYNIGNDEKKVFWGRDCISNLILWMIEIMERNKQSKEDVKRDGRRKILFISFNGARFDNLLLIEDLLIAFHNNIEILGHPNNLKSIIIAEMLYFLDARLIYTQMNLKKLSEKLLKMQKNDFDIMKVVKSQIKYEEYKEEIIKYCLQDAKLVGMLYKSVEGFVKKLFISQGKENEFKNFQWFQPTLALLSINLWKVIFPSNYHIKGCDNWDLYNIEKMSYKGGMCLPIRKSFISSTSHPVLYYYDINSSYPTAMRDYDIPIENGKHHKNYRVFMQKCSFIPTNLYHIRYKFKDDVKIPCLPMRIDLNNTKVGKLCGLLYVKSNFDAPKGDWVWGIEIQEYYDLFEKIECHEHIEYKKGKIFTDYISKLYELRKKSKEEKDEANDFFLKLLMNSCYGKFGQRKFGNIEIMDANRIHEFIANDSEIIKDFVASIKNITPYTPVEENSFFLIEYFPDDNLNFIGGCIKISSYIAALARIQLMRGILDVGMENVYYFDTDSIFTRKKLHPKYIGNQLGDWKCETDEIVEAYFFNPKVYAYKTQSGEMVMKCKGIQQEKLSWNLFKDLDQNGKVKIDGLSEIKHIMTGLYLNEEMEKTITILDKKRIYLSDGDSLPYDNLTKILN